MTDRTIIGFCGPAGCGKSTAAQCLVTVFGYTRLGFADPLKRMMAALGLDVSETSGENKETPLKLLCGHTPRWAMQSLGTEWGRELIGPDLWVRAWEHALPSHLNVVCDDVRFPNEVRMIKELGGMVIKIERPGTAVGTHISEMHDLENDAVIQNDSSMGDLQLRVDAIRRRLSKRIAA